MRLSAEPESIKCPFATHFQCKSVTKLLLKTSENPSLTWMAWALFCSSYLRQGWVGNKKGTLPGRDRRESFCRGAADSPRLPLSCRTGRAQRSTSLCCKRSGSPLPSGGAEGEMLQSQAGKFSVHGCKWLPRVEGCDGSPQTQGPGAVTACVSPPSNALKARPWSCWKPLDQNQLCKCKVHLLILKRRPLLWKKIK